VPNFSGADLLLERGAVMCCQRLRLILRPLGGFVESFVV
jgi:hypothetical protein